MYILDKMDEIKKLEYSFNMIFKSKSPFEQMFTEIANEKMILCPINSYLLTTEQFFALSESIKDIDENEYNISITEYEEIFTPTSQHWKVAKATEYCQYINSEIYLENAIYSNEGLWGILISHEDYAVIGGTSHFINIFKKYYTSWQNDIINFKNMWEMNKKEFGSDLMWIKALEEHFGYSIFNV